MTFGSEQSKTIEFICADRKYIFSNLDLEKKHWYQLTLVYNKLSTGKVTLFIDGAKNTPSLSSSVDNKTNNSGSLFLGKGFIGRLDEIRFWGKALTPDNFQLKNTVNQYHPDYKYLISYWKGDQEIHSKIFDSQNKHHSIHALVSNEPVTDNPNFNYRLVSGYTTFSSFFTREVKRETYLMTNDLLILSGKVNPQGEVSFGPSDESGTLENVNYLPEFKSRKGVLAFTGQNSFMKLNATAIPLAPELSFGAWVYIEKWKNGAAIIQKNGNNDNRFSIRLGESSAKKGLIVQLYGQTLISKGQLKIGEWQYVSVSTKYDSIPKKLVVTFGYYSGSGKAKTEIQSVNTNGYRLSSIDAESSIGDGFCGKMTEMSLWTSDRSEHFTKDAQGIPLAQIGQTISGDYLNDCRAYWKCNNSQNPAFDSYSWQNLVQIIRSAYNGYTGYKVRASFSGGGEKYWESLVCDDRARKNFAMGIARLMQSPLLDGVDLDFEWCYDNTCWTNFSQTIEEVRKVMPVGKIFTVTPHVIAYKLTQHAIQDIDFALFQNYGPSPDRFDFSDYKKSLELFRKQGFSDNKIVLSTSTTTSKGLSKSGAEKKPNAYKNLVSAHPDLAVNANSSEVDDFTYWINSVEQTRQRARFVIDENLAGIMYWDMGCDVPTDNPLSIVRAINMEISSNVQLINN